MPSSMTWPASLQPHRVGDTVGFQLAHIACYQPVQVTLRVRAGDAVFDHRCQIVHRTGIADREIFLFEPWCRRPRLYSRPRGRTDPHGLRRGCGHETAWAAAAAGKPGFRSRSSHAAFFSTCRAALRPATPMTPPPGCEPAPHRKRPATGAWYCAACGTGPHHKELVERQLAMVPVPAGDAEQPLDIGGGSATPLQTISLRKPGARTSIVSRIAIEKHLPCRVPAAFWRERCVLYDGRNHVVSRGRQCNIVRRRHHDFDRRCFRTFAIFAWIEGILDIVE